MSYHKWYKYEVRRLIRRQISLLQKKLAYSFIKSSFWSDVRKLKSSSSSFAPVVDGVAGGCNIANVFASKLEAFSIHTLRHLTSLFSLPSKLQ